MNLTFADLWILTGYTLANLCAVCFLSCQSIAHGSWINLGRKLLQPRTDNKLSDDLPSGRMPVTKKP